MKRRQLLAGAGAAWAMMGSRAARAEDALAATPVITGLEILVAGPASGQMDRWARACAQGLQAGFGASQPVLTRPAGGLDGVTGANRMEALVMPDGRTASMLPGSALIAFLTGDSRVQFQVGHFVPVLAGVSSALLMVHGGLGRLQGQKAGKFRPLRIAADSPQSPDLAAFLALERLGVPFQPVFGLRGIDAKAKAFAAGEADAVLVQGEDVPADAALLSASGGEPLVSLGMIAPDGSIMRDGLFPALPLVSELAQTLGAKPLPALLEGAFEAAAAAARLDFILVLPHLTSPSAIAQWRQAGQSAIAAPAMQSAASGSAVSLLGSLGAEAALAPMGLPAEDILALRSWLMQTFGWRAS